MAAKKKVAAPKLSKEQAVGLGVGLTAAAVAAASAYFLYGSKNAAKNRKVVKSWTLKAKAEVLEKLEDAQNMTQAEYLALIDTVALAYQGVKSASKTDLSTFKKEMKEHWTGIVKEVTPKKKPAAKKVAQSKKVTETKAAPKAAAKVAKKK
jgi:6-phosphogluconolactonase (cycloisomerase 2 family)